MEFSFSAGGGYVSTAAVTNQMSSTSNTAVKGKSGKAHASALLMETKNRRKEKCMRKAAGVIWEDQTLDEWPEGDYRIFCGDLGNEVTDDVLANAFKRYPSFTKAKVIRDKVTRKSKGFGFVSLLNVEDYARAMKEMEGKYIGNRPVKLKKSSWKDKSLKEGRSKLPGKFKKK